MSFGLSRNRPLDTAPGRVAVAPEELPPIPDDARVRPESARVDPRAWFPDPSRPLEIEIGSGKGTFLLQEAGARPGVNFLGIEYAREFFAYAADRIRRHALPNVRLLHADAAAFLHWRVPDRVVRVLHLYFPDPWPKSRHHKRRMVQEQFLRDAHRVLEPGGRLRVVTDHDGYWAWMTGQFARVLGRTDANEAPLFGLEAFDPPASAGQGELVGSNFERKYARQGRPFHAVALVRLPLPGADRGV